MTAHLFAPAAHRGTPAPGLDLRGGPRSVGGPAHRKGSVRAAPAAARTDLRCGAGAPTGWMLRDGPVSDGGGPAPAGGVDGGGR